MCPSMILPVTAGDSYYLIVNSGGDCVSSTADYKLSLDVPSDPSLTLLREDMPFWQYELIEAGGSVLIE
jgi:hypothetical protein